MLSYTEVMILQKIAHHAWYHAKLRQKAFQDGDERDASESQRLNLHLLPKHHRLRFLRTITESDIGLFQFRVES